MLIYLKITLMMTISFISSSYAQYENVYSNNRGDEIVKVTKVNFFHSKTLTLDLTNEIDDHIQCEFKKYNTKNKFLKLNKCWIEEAGLGDRIFSYVSRGFKRNYITFAGSSIFISQKSGRVIIGSTVVGDAHSVFVEGLFRYSYFNLLKARVSIDFKNNKIIID